jgi:radical SAM superfamily enzyme YgiQ (UPF0313 family)
MKVLFLHENSLEESLGVANLSAMLKSQGHICDVLIQDVEGRNFFKKTKAFSPDIIAFSCSTGRHIWANRIAEEIKRFLNVLAIMGGIHPTIYREEAIMERNIDIICIGEGEYPLLELANRLEKKQDITGIRNLWVKMDKKIFKNDLRDLNDVNSLPYPDRSLYYKYYYHREMPIKRFISSIGCLFTCSFCQNPLLRRLYKGKGVFVRRKDVERIISEILYIKKHYPLELIHFSDDIFALDKDWLKEFSVRYKKIVGLPFNCNIRISCLDEDMVKLLKAAGCHAVTFGLESGNELLRNKMVLKNTTDEEILEKTAILRKCKIKILTSNMIALPQESISNAYETVQLNRKIKVNYTRIFLVKPYKGTELFEYGKRNLLLGEKAFDSKNFEALDNIYFKTGYEREFKNLRYLFYLIVKFPILEKPSHALIKLPFTKMYNFLFFITTIIQEQKFYKMRFLKGILLCSRFIKGYGKHY